MIQRLTPPDRQIEWTDEEIEGAMLVQILIEHADEFELVL